MRAGLDDEQGVKVHRRLQIAEVCEQRFIDPICIEEHIRQICRIERLRVVFLRKLGHLQLHLGIFSFIQVCALSACSRASR